MDESQTELNTAIEVARNALADWRAEPTPAKFRTWRDASEIAIKWHRACRLGSGESETFDQGLDKLLSR